MCQEWIPHRTGDPATTPAGGCGAAGWKSPPLRAPLRYKRRPSVITNAFHRLYPDIHDYMYRGKSHELSQCRSGSN